MSSSTGIEIGPDSCVLAGVRSRRRGPEIFAVHTVDASAWPGQDVALAGLLRSVRRDKKLPRTARVVAWGLPEGARADDPVTRAQLRPIVAAGFRIDAVLSPPQALAQLAASRARSGDGATAWLALNRSGVAIAIVRGAELLFSRAFDWSFAPDQSGMRSELLQRYSLVSHLAPEVQRGIAMVKGSHGVTVETAITCGDLPDLRSLTMPLIEELDLEVETLDSTEGLRATGLARNDRLAELAPSIRLAVAAATARSQRRGAGPLVALAAAAVLIVGLGWAGYAYWAVLRPRPQQAPVTTRAATTPRPAPPKPAPVKPAPAVTTPPAQSVTPPETGSPVATPPVSTPSQPPVAAKPPVTTPSPEPVTKAPMATPPVAKPTQPPVTKAPVTKAPPTQPPAAVTKPPVTQPPVTKPAPVTKAPVTAPSAPAAKPAPQQVRTSPADTGREPSAKAPVEPPRPAPLKDPLPTIELILVDQSRRIAVIGGAFVSVGDRVGPRVVAQIEPDFVVLREPSGVLVRVPIRGK